MLRVDGCGGPVAWAPSGVASRPRTHHASFVATTAAGTFLYVIGGSTADGSLTNADRASVQDDGSLGAFVADPDLPVATSGHTGQVVGDTIAIVGGMSSSKSWSAVIQADGSLGAWVRGPDVTRKRMHGGSFSIGDQLYMMGGFDTAGVWDDVLVSTVSDGTLSSWAAAGLLPGPRSHFTADLVGGYLYLVGGFDTPAFQQPKNLTSVWRGRVGDDGMLGDWTAMPELPVGKAGHGSFYYGGYLYVAGGLSDDLQAEDTIFRAPIGADHMLGAWESAPSLPIARGHVHQLPVWQNHVYSISGAVDSMLDATTEIDIGSF
jgi:hypothetical protein